MIAIDREFTLTEDQTSMAQPPELDPVIKLCGTLVDEESDYCRSAHRLQLAYPASLTIC